MSEAPAVVGAASLDPADAAAAEKTIEQWKIKKLIKSLEQARGFVLYNLAGFCDPFLTSAFHFSTPILVTAMVLP
jgi:hypothetical protein